MPWIRLSDDYVDHPKFSVLSDGAFRLWHEGMSFCRKFQTDGLIPNVTLKDLRSFSAKRVRELITPWQPGKSALWETVEDFGVKVHDYLVWNLSKEEEQTDRSAATARMRKFRKVKKPEPQEGCDAAGDAVVTSLVTRHEQRSDGVCDGVGDAIVPERNGKERKILQERKEDPSFGSSKRPLFSGQRFTVFEWQLDGIQRLLGPHFEDFDVHAWFFALDERVVQAREIVPQRDGGAWLLAQTQAEAIRRGLAMATAASADEAIFAALVAKGPSVRPV